MVSKIGITLLRDTRDSLLFTAKAIVLLYRLSGQGLAEMLITLKLKGAWHILFQHLSP